MPVATPARRARARRDPAIARPPSPPKADRESTVRNLHLQIAGRPWLIGPHIEGDPELAATIDGAGTTTINVRDTSGNLREALADEAQLLQTGVTVAINRVVYTLQEPSSDESNLVTLPFQDQVAWRLQQYRRFIAVSRAHSTFGQFAKRLVDEASAPPLAPIGFFCPELDELQPIAKATSDDDTGQPARDRGTGADSAYTVKHQRAKGEQRDNIDSVLGRAQKRDASRRVMIAAIMAATQESVLLRSATNGTHVGLYGQDPAYGTEAQRRDPEHATDGFLDEWKRVHGSVKTVRGALAAAIEQVQRSGQGDLYAAWEDEATKTVDRWLGQDGHDGSSRQVAEPYEFTRGERHGAEENSWDCIGRYAEERAWRRWAQANVLALVSDDELRAAAPSVEIHGDEEWLLGPPAWTWSARRPVNEVTIRVLADRWDMQIGAGVLLATGDLARGRFEVAEERGAMVNPEIEVTLRRPAPKKPEPPHTVRSASSSSSSGGDNDLLHACEDISRQGRDYKYGGGHGKPLSKITAHEALDCSSSCCLALSKAGLFDGKTAVTSGELARTYGKAGKGHDWTLYANDTHAFIHFEGDGRYKRFDTRPWGGGDKGPRVRTEDTPDSDKARFTARHHS